MRHGPWNGNTYREHTETNSEMSISGLLRVDRKTMEHVTWTYKHILFCELYEQFLFQRFDPYILERGVIFEVQFHLR